MPLQPKARALVKEFIEIGNETFSCQFVSKTVLLALPVNAEQFSIFIFIFQHMLTQMANLCASLHTYEIAETAY